MTQPRPTVGPERVRGVLKWRLYSFSGGKRRRRYFDSESAALDARDRIIAESNGAGEWVATLSPRERERLGMILEEMHERGVSVEEVWRRFKAGQFSVSETEVTLGRAVEEYLVSLKAAGRADKTISDRRERLARFVRGREGMRLHEVRLAMLEEYLAGYESPGGRATVVSRLRALFSFCVRRQWLPRNPCDQLERVTVRYRAPVSLSVSESRAIMEATLAVAPRMIPVVVLSLFAGLRPDSEARRMQWEWINLDAGYLIKPASIGKLDDERRVNLTPNTVAWLRLGGKLPLGRGVREEGMRAIRKASGVTTWVNDILRHTAATYHVQIHGMIRTAEQLGTSEKKLHQNYRSRIVNETDGPKHVDKAYAEEFFKIFPPKK